MTTPITPLLTTAHRLVVKIGSALLVEAGGDIRRGWLDALADDVAACRARGQEVVLVTSGAIAVGRQCLGLPPGPLLLAEKQAAAATGQIRLAHAYQAALARHNLTVAQVLLTLEDTEARRRHLNARATLNTLLHLGAIPVINENDTVTTAEIRFGDNDRLAARVTQMISADTLVLLSDIDGLYTADPRNHPEAELIPVVPDITPDIAAMAGEPPTGSFSSGGMITKIAAGRIATAAGARMCIAFGRDVHALARLDSPGPCTWFLPSSEPLSARKRWIAGHVSDAGTITADPGAVTALHHGASLLPAGVKSLSGMFERGDVVMVQDITGQPVARGLASYGSADAFRILGRHSRDFEALLGYHGGDVLIHHDDLVLL